MKDDQLLLRGALCVLIGGTILIGPHVLRSSGWLELLAGAQTVGWFAVALGIALIAVGLVRRRKR